MGGWGGVIFRQAPPGWVYIHIYPLNAFHVALQLKQVHEVEVGRAHSFGFVLLRKSIRFFFTADSPTTAAAHWILSISTGEGAIDWGGGDRLGRGRSIGV